MNLCLRWSFTKNHYMMHGQQNIKLQQLLVTVYLVITVMRQTVIIEDDGKRKGKTVTLWTGSQ